MKSYDSDWDRLYYTYEEIDSLWSISLTQAMSKYFRSKS